MFLLAAAVTAVYWRITGHPFILLDDTIYITENPVVLDGLTLAGVRHAFSSTQAANWHPLTWLSHMLDVSLFGVNAGRHHAVNLLLHLANGLLLLVALRKMTGSFWRSAAVAALFALHPLHVESVAWASERKDVLCGLFFALSLIAYRKYCERPGTARYLALFALFALGLMAKPTIVPLPFLLLLLDYWPLGRIFRDGVPGYAQPEAGRGWQTGWLPVLEKVPLLILSAGSAAVTLISQRGEGSVAMLPAGAISNAGVSFAAYLGKTAWPASLSFFYPHPIFRRIPHDPPAWRIAASILLLAAISVVAVREIRRRPYIAIGWSWFLGMLVPMMGFIQAGEQAMADRYMYLPVAGLFLIVAWGGGMRRPA